MVTSEQMKRLEQLEAANRAADMQPALAKLEAEYGFSADEIWAESERINNATEGLSRDQAMHWLAQDLAASTSMTEDEALAVVRDWDW